MGNESVVMCLFCGKLSRYKSIIISVDERIMALKMLRTCGDGVLLSFLAVMRCSLIFLAVLRCSEPPHVPL